MDLGSCVIGRKLSDIYANFRTVLGGILVHREFGRGGGGGGGGGGVGYLSIGCFPDPPPPPLESDGFVFVTATLSFLTLKEVVIRLADSR